MSRPEMRTKIETACGGCGHDARVHSDSVTSWGPVGCLTGGGYSGGPECPCSVRESEILHSCPDCASWRGADRSDPRWVRREVQPGKWEVQRKAVPGFILAPNCTPAPREGESHEQEVSP